MNILFRHTMPKQLSLKGRRAASQTFASPAPRALRGRAGTRRLSSRPRAAPSQAPLGVFRESPSREPTPLMPRVAIFSRGFQYLSSCSLQTHESTPPPEQSFVAAQSCPLATKQHVCPPTTLREIGDGQVTPWFLTL